jgi:hypothetical protein
VLHVFFAPTAPFGLTWSAPVDSAAGDLVGQGEHLIVGGGEPSGEGHVPIDLRPGGGVQIEGLPAAAILLPQPHVITLDAEHLLDGSTVASSSSHGSRRVRSSSSSCSRLGASCSVSIPAIIVTAVTGCQFGSPHGVD